MKTLDYFEMRSTKDTTGCWLWDRHLDRYGVFRDEGQLKKAHRGAWEAVNGAVPEGMHVLHRCDVPRCCNPEHLFLGTHADNMRDKVSKGRQSRSKLKGSQHGMAKLVEHDVSIIKLLLDLGVQGKRLADLYGVSKSSISLIRLGRKWRHVAPLEAR